MSDSSSRPAKKPRASRALKSKVLGLETQMQQMQTSLDGVLSLLQTSLARPMPVPDRPVIQSTPWNPVPNETIEEDEPLGYSAMRSMLRAEEQARLQTEGKRKRSADDPVDAGLCSESEGQQLFNLFFEKSHAFMPVFDPAVDTWYSLRQRSAFCISAIIYIAKKTQEGGHQGDAQKRLRDHVEGIGRGLFFSPEVSVEIVQAMIILSAWGDTVGRPGFMALSMAYDMDLHRCLPQLKSNPSRSLVVGSRLWLITAKQSIEMSINYSRPLCVSELDILPHMHSLLHQIYTISTDSRIVASCEHLLYQLPLHRMILSGDDHLDDALRMYNDQAQAWLIRWQTYYEHRGIPSTNVLFSDLHNQLAFGLVQANSFLLRSVSRDNLNLLSLERRRWLLTSLDHATQITQRIILSEKDKLFYANHFSHVALASVFRIYVRLASLFPERVDLRKTAKDLTAVADILSQFPGVSFAHNLRQIIQRARQSNILPVKTRASTPLADPPFDLDDLFGQPQQDLEGLIGELLSYDNSSNDLNSWLDFGMSGKVAADVDFGNQPL